MVKLRGQSFWEVNNEYSDSWNWKVLLNLRDKAKQHIEYRIGNGGTKLLCAMINGVKLVLLIRS